MTAASQPLQWRNLIVQSGVFCCAIFLTAACAGCGAGLVYRPDPEPRQEYPVDISVEQEIYAATAKQPPKAEPAVAPAQTEKPAPAASTQPADHFYSVHLFSFKQPGFARSAAQKLAAQTGQPVFIKETGLPGSGTWQRVYAGMFPSEASAKAFGGKIKSDGISDYFCVYRLAAPLAAESRH
jgi:hypothetical protein